MFYINNPRQLTLFNPFSFLGPKRLKILELSWAGLFKEEILCELPVAKLSSFFNRYFGRPSKELYTMLGVILLQQAHNLTDEETVHQLAFNIQWHYALNITDESDSAKYISLKTLWNIRQTATDKALDNIIFDKIAKKLAVIFNVNPDKQRLDSVQIKSNMARLGRIRIFATTINKFLVNLKRRKKEHFESVGSKIVEKYLSEKAMGCFSMVKPSESNKTLHSVGKDLFELVQQFKGCSEVVSMNSYKLLERVLKEHCNITGSDNNETVEIKKPKDIPSDSLQNPSDPDATYSGHKGQGYQVQVMETYTDTEDKDVKAKTLNLITHVEVEKACQSDAQALIPAIESAKKRKLCPKELEADSLYGSDENCEAAKSKGVELVSPTMGTPDEGTISLADFEFLDNGHVAHCPKGHAPIVLKKSKKSWYSQSFCLETCAECPLVEDCPVKQGKKFYYLRYGSKEVRIAKRRAIEQTDEFKERYRWRAGGEATMSEYDRRTGVKHLRYRRIKKVRFAAVLKAAAINIFRASVVKMAINPA
ncbi:MAG: transposase [Candidatus Hodarchaeales archaeon]|jgi:hypothetical protein